MRLSSLVFPSSSFAGLLFATSLAQSVLAQDRTTEQGEAQIIDATQECTPYYYAPTGQAVAAGQFPPIWTPATIVATDTNAMAKYQSIQSQIPNIPPKGTQPGSLTGNWTGLTYPTNDPDCWWTYEQCTTPKVSGLPPDVAFIPEPNTLGYAFDDGPNCSHNAFYDYLQQNNQKATMFYIGSSVMDWPLEAQRGLADGHEICVHTWSHRYMTALTNEEVFAEFYYSKSSMQAIKLVVGVTPTCWRPPFGDVDDRVRAIAHALGLQTIIWKYDSNDWRAGTGNITTTDVDANYEGLIQRAQNGTFDQAGTLMLTHELNNFTMSEAVKFYDQLKAAFKYIVPVGVALNRSQPYVENNYSLPSFDQYISGTTTLNGGPSPTATGSSGGGGSGGSGVSGGSGGGGSGGSNGGGHGTNGSGSAQKMSSMGGLVVSFAFVGALLRALM